MSELVGCTLDVVMFTFESLMEVIAVSTEVRVSLIMSSLKSAGRGSMSVALVEVDVVLGLDVVVVGVDSGLEILLL